MPPKKKGNKKAQDDWEADLGETITPSNAAAESNDAAEPEADADDDAAGGGGLMAMLRKNKEKRKKKGLVQDDFVEGEDAPGAEPANGNDLNNKAPQEATLDDEFDMPGKKGKGPKGKAAPKKNEPADEEDAESGRILTKAEKEKLKKEREKQRKKEQVRLLLLPICICSYTYFYLCTNMHGFHPATLPFPQNSSSSSFPLCAQY